MSKINRRSFLQSIGALVPAAALGACETPEAAEAGAAGPPLEAGLLLALAETVLPSELGPEGVQRVASGFQEWIARFEPVAELNHGYGTGEIRFTAADPAPGWGAQLRALNLLAQRAHGAPFPELPAEQRRELVRAQIRREGPESLPTAADADHVAVGLMAYYYDSPEATDLCYQAAIRKYGCRPLSQSPERPAPLQPRA